MGLPLILGALAAGGAMTGLGGYLAKGKEVYDPYGTLNPEQRAIVKALGSNLNTYANAPASSYQYTGDFTAPMTQGEQDLVSQNSRLSALMDTGSMKTLLSGEWSPEAEDYYQNTMYKPAMKEYQEDIQPQIEESYAGPGGYWGGARADAVRSGYQDVADTLAAKKAELAWNVFNAPTTAYPVAQNWQTASAAIQGIPRSITQYGLDKKYEDYTAAYDKQKSYIDQALSFLNISTGTLKKKDTGGIWPYLLGGLGSAITGAATAGAAGMAGGTTVAGKSPGPQPGKVIW